MTGLLITGTIVLLTAAMVVLWKLDRHYNHYSEEDEQRLHQSFDKHYYRKEDKHD